MAGNTTPGSNSGTTESKAPETTITPPDPTAATAGLRTAIEYCEATDNDALAHELGQLYQRLGGVIRQEGGQ